MKIFIVLCLASVIFGRPTEDDPDGMPYFDQNRLSSNFREYQNTGCSAEVNTCLREMHESVVRCVNEWKTQAGARYEHCIKNDPVVVNASRDWQEPSMKWHKAMDQCLSGTQAPSEESLQSLAIQNAAMAFFSRKKRDTPSADQVTTCWRNSRQQRDQCKEKAIACAQFAHCYGEGAEPSDESTKRWYNHIKKLREQTREKSKTYIMHMGHCLRNEPHSDHGSHSGHGVHHGHHNH